MDVPLLVTIVLGGLALIVCYVVVFRKEKQGYIKSRMWMGYPKSIVYMLITFQVLALIGFFMAYFTPGGLIFGKSPAEGLLSRGRWVTSLLTGIFLISSCVWPFMAARSFNRGDSLSRFVCAASLVVSSIAIMLLLAGSVEEIEKPRVIVVTGLLLLAITVVLADGVMWNARFILTKAGSTLPVEQFVDYTKIMS